MGLFSKGKSGGMMNVIRCDEEEYLVWKWRPLGQDVNSTSRENAIRYGSSLRVKDGELAVFVYKQKDGTLQDFIVGPYDDTIKTANFPVLSSIVGLAFGGESPFQAEIYFINLQGNNQVRFSIPYFDVTDPRLPDHPIPVSVQGTLTFYLEDYRAFIKLNRLINFDLDAFKKQISDAMTRKIKGIITNVPSDLGMPAVQMERKIDEISELLETRLKDRLDEFGVKMKHIDIGSINIDKDSDAYIEMKSLTGGQTAKVIKAQTDLGIKNLQDTQRISLSNMEDTMRIQREEAQRAQRLQTESNFMGAHALDQQTSVLKTAAGSLGQMGNVGGGNGGMNPAGMMTGMMMGGAMGSQMAGMMNGMGQQMQNAMNTPPPMPNSAYYIAVNGQQSGPFNTVQLQQMAQSGQITHQTLVWKNGMPQWAEAGNVPELASLFAVQTPPPVPGMPPAPPTPPTI